MINDTPTAWAVLRTPDTQRPVRLETDPAEVSAYHAAEPTEHFTPLGVTDQLAVADDDTAYPVIEGIPILMKPERLSRGSTPEGVDTTKLPYAEAYQEQVVYDQLTEAKLGGAAMDILREIIRHADPAKFPEPLDAWVTGGSSAGAYARAMQHLAPVDEAMVLQVGGIGSHAIKLLHAGARHAYVVSPVIGELIEGQSIADQLGFGDRITFIGGLAEQLPMAAASVDRAYSGSSLHHTDTTASMPAIAAALTDHGRFASVDVWRGGKLYDVGVRLFGKCNNNPYCKPMTHERIAPASVAFDHLEVTMHGAVARYPLAVASRLGRTPSPRTAVKMAHIEDRVAKMIPPLQRRMSSLICVTGVKSPPKL